MNPLCQYPSYRLSNRKDRLVDRCLLAAILILIGSMICTGCMSHSAAMKLPLLPPTPTVIHQIVTHIVHVPAVLQPTASLMDFIMPLSATVAIAGFVLLIAMEIFGLNIAIRLPLAIMVMGGAAFAAASLLRMSLWLFTPVAWTVVGLIATGAVFFIRGVIIKMKAGESPVQAVEDEIHDLTAHTAPLVKA